VIPFLSLPNTKKNHDTIENQNSNVREEKKGKGCREERRGNLVPL